MRGALCCFRAEENRDLGWASDFGAWIQPSTGSAAKVILWVYTRTTARFCTCNVDGTFRRGWKVSRSRSEPAVRTDEYQVGPVEVQWQRGRTATKASAR